MLSGGITSILSAFRNMPVHQQHETQGPTGSTGEALFFIDNDCIVTDATIPQVRKNLSLHPPGVVVGGTYTPVPYDTRFFSAFQSAFINYFETKNVSEPDYLATHALVIRAASFKEIGGFTEDFLPILEDVEFSHRLARNGFKLIMDPDLQVRHIFHHTLERSLLNAFNKTRYWIEYSLANRDLFADSGTASREIKINGVTWLVTVALVLMYLTIAYWSCLLAPLPFLWAANLFMNRRLYNAFLKAQGAWFAFKAGMLLFPSLSGRHLGRVFQGDVPVLLQTAVAKIDVLTRIRGIPM